MRFENTHESSALRWDSLTNADTGTSLELEPGDSAEVDVPEGFDDPWLKPAAFQSSPPEAPEAVTPAPEPATEE